METQKIINLLNSTENEYSKFATKKWCVIDSESKGNYSHENPSKFLTNSLESSICDYSDAYILVTGNINVAGADNTKVAFKNCSPFRKCRIEINETFIDEAEDINIAMPMYNFIEYSDNYSDTSGSLWQFRGDEIEGNVDLTVDNHIPNNSSSYKYKSSLITNRNGIKIAGPLKYLSNFWRSLQILLINCKVEFPLTWNENCILTSFAGNSTFTITDAKFYVPVVTLSIEDNARLTELLSEGFERSAYWNKYKVIPNKTYNQNNYMRELLDASFQGAKRLFVLDNNAGDDLVTANSHRRYFLPRIKIENYNVKIDGRNFYDQPINDLIKQYDEVRKISTGQGDDYTTGCLLDFAYFKKKNYRLIAANLSKQKALDADPRAIQQIIFTGKASRNVAIYYILEQSKETILKFYKGTTNIL